MCGRFYIESEDPDGELRAIIAEVQSRMETSGSVKTGEIFPSDVVPVIANDKTIVPRAFPMKWGLPRSGGGLVINARSETASAKPMFRDSAQKRRCLIPASYYFEWEKRGSEKIKYAIKQAGRGTTYLGGLYVLDKNSQLALFTVLTRPVAERIAFIHDRMPVIVPAERLGDWLSPQNGLDNLLKSAVEDVEYREA